MKSGAKHAEKRQSKSETRLAAKKAEKEAKSEEKTKLEAKYDVNQVHSDDSSDEEVLLRTGNVPPEWYALHDHTGYTVKGERVVKPKPQDELEKFVERQGDKEWWKKIHDFVNNKDVTLTKADLDLLRRLRSGRFADAEVDPFEVFEVDDNVEKELFQHPLNNASEPKRRFVPSKWERLKVSKFIRALKKGWMKTLA
jgi:ribosome biogenesis protein ERB1